MGQNICCFLPKQNLCNSFDIINAVYETECIKEIKMCILATYRLHFITEGAGLLHTPQGTRKLKAGNLYIVPPACEFAIENTENIRYIFISCIGIQLTQLAEQFKIENDGNIYSDFENLSSLWESVLNMPNEVANIRCESVVLYTFSEIGKRIFTTIPKKVNISIAEKIKEFIDENFTNSSINLDYLGKEFSYHPKYISTIFKKKFKLGVVDYLQTIRIQQACTLMAQGFTSLKDISALCGFNDPLYFSRIFKSKLRVTPKEHIILLEKSKFKT